MDVLAKIALDLYGWLLFWFPEFQFEDRQLQTSICLGYSCILDFDAFLLQELFPFACLFGVKETLS